jgi:hypothetical protein
VVDLSQDKDKTPRLSERVEAHRKEAEFLVSQGGEQPRYEFKRSVSLSRDNLGDRCDFIKLLQGIANAEVHGERCIVIGADPKEKKFYPISNLGDFDPAKVSQILTAYLEPTPRFEVFNVTTDTGDALVLIVLDANQPRPIIATKQAQTQDGKVRLEVGDIWIKKNTELVRATSADLSLMYEARIEKEAEDRARKRLSHLIEISPTLRAPQTSALRAPDPSLLVGPKNDLRSFAKELIASSDHQRLKMLLEIAREQLVDGWDDLRGNAPTGDVRLFTSNVTNFFRDRFFPSLQSAVELGLLVIKYAGDEEWITSVIDVLMEAFDATRGMNWLKSGYMLQQTESISWWKPAFDIYAGIRAIAVYAVLRSRLKFLGPIIHRTVCPISIDDRQLDKAPVLFWPLHFLEFPPDWHKDGRATFLWERRVAAAWGEYFGTPAKFDNSSAQLEFLLILNSYIGTNAFNDPKLEKWLDLNAKETSYQYFADLYAQDLSATIPMAERIYDILSSDSRFPNYLAIDHRMLDQFFAVAQPAQRLEIYGKFLYDLKEWQAQTRFQQLHRFPFLFSWEGRLHELAEKYKKRLAASK